MPRTKKEYPEAQIAIHKGIHDLLVKINSEESKTIIKQTLNNVLWEFLYKPPQCDDCEIYSEWMGKVDLWKVQYDYTPEDEIPFTRGKGRKTDYRTTRIREDLNDRLVLMIEAKLDLGEETDKKTLLHQAIVEYFVRPKAKCYKCAFFRNQKHEYQRRQQQLLRQKMDELENTT